jgi:two-component sensor histidine kinase
MSNAQSRQDIEPSRLGLSLRSRPVRIALIATLLPIALLGAVFLAMLDAERRTALDHATGRAASAAGMATRQYIGEEIGRLEGLAVSSAIDRQDWNALHAEAQRLLAKHPHWLNVILTDNNRQVFNTRRFDQSLPPVRDQATVRRVFETREPAVGHLVPGETGLGTAFRVPVIRDDAVRYTLVAPAQPALFSRVLREQNLPPGWTAVTVDANDVVAGVSGAIGAVGAPLESALAAALPDALNRMVPVRMADDSAYHVAAAPVGMSGWRVLVLAPATIAGGPSQVIEYAAWAATAAGAVLAVVLVGALLTASISRRNLASLARANERLRASQEHQQLLAREIDHRSKNLLALVQTILRLTRAQTVTEYARAAQGRIAALGRAHTLLSQARWEGADLGRLVSEELAPHRGTAADRVVVEGPALPLAAQAAQSLAMAIHELATNAVKYGALSSPAGRVAVHWAWRGDSLEMHWREQGGPSVHRPGKEGVGMSVVERSVVQQLEGVIRFAWNPDGLHCTLTAPRRTLQRG